MISKLLHVFIQHSHTAIIFCQLGLPTGGAVDAVRKESFAVDLLSGIVIISWIVIGVLWKLLLKKDKEIADMTDTTIKDVK